MNSAPVLTCPVSLEQSSDLSEPQEQMKEGVFIRGFYPVSRRWRWSKGLSWTSEPQIHMVAAPWVAVGTEMGIFLCMLHFLNTLIRRM